MALDEGFMANREWPTALTLGSDAANNMNGYLQADQDRINDWKDVSKLTDFKD